MWIVEQNAVKIEVALVQATVCMQFEVIFKLQRMK